MHQTDQNEGKNCWQRFEDYWWYHSHDLFEEHASQKKAAIITPYKVILIRLALLLILAFDYFCAAYSHLVSLKNIIYLTKWGLWVTIITLLLGLFQSPYKRTRAANPKKYSKYNPLALWKLYTVLYQFALINNVLITIVFWSGLWAFAKK